MPLSRLQSCILLALAAQRSSESDVAGGAVLNRDGPRVSADMDVFHDREAAVAAAAAHDAETLTAEGYQIDWLHREPGLHAAVVRRGDEATRLEWARDSDFRFFSTVKDDVFGWRLHLLDLATNKALAAAGRREPRDVVDLIHIHDRHLPLGAVVWASVAKDPGYSPESLIAEIRRNARYRADDYADLAMSGSLDAASICRRTRSILDDADRFVARMPAGQEGLAYLEAGRVVQPDPDRLGAYETIAGKRGGHWPSSADIAGAMIERDGS